MIQTRGILQLLAVALAASSELAPPARALPAGTSTGPTAAASARVRKLAIPSVRQTPPQGAAMPPQTPPGLPSCVEALRPTRRLPRRVGETMRYVVDVNGISVGTVDFRIERRGSHQSQPVTEYRSIFRLDKLVATIVPVEGRAAALVPDPGFVPRLAMNRYRLDENDYQEDMSYDQEGRVIESTRATNERKRRVRRAFVAPVPDFVTAFYALRRLPRTMRGCMIIYGNQRAYTVWLDPAGSESVKTPVGRRVADRYELRYGSERSKGTITGTLWMAVDGERMPYEVELRGTSRLTARIHLYEPGEQ